MKKIIISSFITSFVFIVLFSCFLNISYASCNLDGPVSIEIPGQGIAKGNISGDSISINYNIPRTSYYRTLYGTINSSMGSFEVYDSQSGQLINGTLDISSCSQSSSLPSTNGCTPPSVKDCNSGAEALAQNRNGLGGTSMADGAIQDCQNRHIQYQAEIASYNACINSSSGSSTTSNTSMEEFLQTFKNRQSCQKNDPNSFYDEKVQRCSCLGGTKLNTNGVCACPINSYLSTGTCMPKEGYTRDNNGNYVLKTQSINDNPNTVCINSFGSHSIASSTKVGYCTCVSGYEWATDKKSCVISIVDPDEGCKNPYGQYSIISPTDSNSCACVDGYEWNKNTTACVAKINEKVDNKNNINPTVVKKAVPTKVEDINEALKSIDVNNVTNIEPVKKVSWFRKIFNWFMGK